MFEFYKLNPTSPFHSENIPCSVCTSLPKLCSCFPYWSASCSPPRTVCGTGVTLFKPHWKTASIFLPSRRYTSLVARISHSPYLTLANTSRIFHFRDVSLRVDSVIHHPLS